MQIVAILCNSGNFFAEKIQPKKKKKKKKPSQIWKWRPFEKGSFLPTFNISKSPG